ncbi:MAG: ABC transporter permease [Chloroflexi bacterium]|nr:ABC transporter permease [Chloroflexota bacterium]
MASDNAILVADDRTPASLRRRIQEARLPWIPLAILVVILFCAIFANLVSPHDPGEKDVFNKLQPPFQSADHILGTDRLGKDMLSRLIYGARTMLQVTAPSMVVAILAGTVVGLVSGYSGRWVDSVLMRITDAVLGFPSILVALLIVTYLGTGVWNVMIAIAATQWARFARMIRGEVLAIRDRDFVVLAQIYGVSSGMIVWRHLFPNVINTLMVLTSVSVGQVILLEASLSFLGLGLRPGDPAWGILVAEGREFLTQAWWIALFPGILITVVVMAFNFFGDWLRDYLDPRLRRAG